MDISDEGWLDIWKMHRNRYECRESDNQDNSPIGVAELGESDMSDNDQYLLNAWHNIHERDISDV